jgi:HTH-type transcriptional regulator/antitoxin HigA
MGTEPKPIRTAADYERALVALEGLWGAESGTVNGDRLDVLATLIDAYEAEHDPIDTPDPIDAIKFRMEQQRLSRKDLEVWIGTRTRVAEVLNGKRRLSIGMIRRLHEGLGIPAEILIRPAGYLGPDADLNASIERRRAARGRAQAGDRESRDHLGRPHARSRNAARSGRRRLPAAER